MPAGDGSSLLLPGVSGIMPAGTKTGVRGASLEVRGDRREIPIRVIRKHEAWPEVSLWDGKSLR